MNKLEELRVCADIADLARMIGMSPRGLSYIAYKVPNSQKYVEFEIPKKSGGTRLISAPTRPLKNVQKKLSFLLQECLSDIEANLGIKEDCALAHGFHRGRSIITNAELHVGCRWVLNVDLQDFFPSINFGRVYGFLSKNSFFNLKKPIAAVISQIACHNGTLPQGSPLSPVLSNLICQSLDVRLAHLARTTRSRYSRYADDITFSTSKREIPPELATHQDGTIAPGKRLSKEIRRAGFELNPAKARLQFQRSRQDCTGLVVNRTLGVPREYRKKIRARCLSLTRKGTLTDDAGGTLSSAALRGQYSHVFNVLGKASAYARPDKSIDILRWPAFFTDYRRLLDFTYFANAAKPMIITEGETDDAYIKASMRSLAVAFPQLTSGPAKSDRRIDFFSYSRTSGSIQCLSGGTGDLKRLIHDYNKRVGKMEAAAFAHPVIIIVDNDCGAREVFAAVKNVTKSNNNVDGSQRFYYITKNLYLVPLPKVGTADTYIEMLLPANVQAIVINGKTFEGDPKKFDDRLHFGKTALAKHVQSNWSTIDFSGFSTLLGNISSVISDFASRKGGAA